MCRLCDKMEDVTSLIMRCHPQRQFNSCRRLAAVRDSRGGHRPHGSDRRLALVRKRSHSINEVERANGLWKGQRAQGQPIALQHPAATVRKISRTFAAMLGDGKTSAAERSEVIKRPIRTPPLSP